MFSFQSPFLVCSPWNVIYSFTVWEYIILFSYDGWGGWSSKPKEIHNLFFKNQQATFGILIQINKLLRESWSMYSETSLFLKSPNDRIIIFRYKVIVEYLSTNQPSGLWMEMHVLYCLQKWAFSYE